MAVTTKTPEERAVLREGGAILAQTLAQVADAVRPGIPIADLDALARRLLEREGGVPAFLGYGKGKGVPGFPATLCVSINDEVVHGIGNRPLFLRDGDIVGLDIGVKYKGLFTDMAVTVGVGAISSEASRLLKTTQAALATAIDAVRPGAWTKEISQAIQRVAEGNGFAVIRDLTGHGVGYAVHEDPPIFCYWNERMPNVQLKEGMVICIEPMVTSGTWRVTVDPDHWTIRTSDGSLAAHFEETIAVTADGHEVLTRLS